MHNLRCIVDTTEVTVTHELAESYIFYILMKWLENKCQSGSSKLASRVTISEHPQNRLLVGLDIPPWISMAN
jgi:hypothetical protein